MRYSSLTLTGLILAWRRGDPSLAILAKSFSDYDRVIRLGQCKSWPLKVCGIEKRTCYSKQIDIEVGVRQQK